MSGLSASCADLLTCLLEKDPSRRITLENLLQHPFLNQPPSTSSKSAQVFMLIIIIVYLKISNQLKGQSSSKSISEKHTRNAGELSTNTTTRVEQKPQSLLAELCI